MGLIIGLVLKLLTIPSCALAAYMTPPVEDVAGIHPSMNDYQQVCWGSRGTITIIELFHYTGNAELQTHHVFVLLAMILTVVYNGPHRGLDLSMGALVSEVPSLTFSIIKEMGLLGKYPTLEWALLVAAAGLTLAIRVPAIFIGMAMLPTSGLWGEPRGIVLVGYLFYLTYNLNISWRRLRRAQVWQTWQSENGNGDFDIRITRRFVISSSAFFAGFGILSLYVLLLVLYSMFDVVTKDKLTIAAVLSVPALLATVHVLQRNQRWHPWFVGAVHQLTSFRMPRLSKIGRWIVGLWTLYFLHMASLGDTPERHNRHLDPVEILARSPPFCDLILTWQFWVCAATALLMPMFMLRTENGIRSPGTRKGRIVEQHED